MTRKKATMTMLTNILNIAAGAGGLALAGVGARLVYDSMVLRWMQRKTFDAKLDVFRQRSAVKTMRLYAPDDHGRIGWVSRPDGSIVNLDTLTMLDDQWNVARIDQVAERVASIERMLLSMPNPSGDVLRQLQEPEGPQVPQLPEYVTSDQALDAAPSYRRLILGRTEHQTVTADMAKMVHLAVGGSTGWGKSVFLRWMVYQLVKSTDPVKIILIDLEGATLAPFAQCGRVLYPLADTETDAAAIMTELISELDRRKALYAQYPGVDSLYAYNEQSDEPLVPIVAVIDEATALLENRVVEKHLRTLALRARKYGLWLILAGQDWKASTLDTAIRNQLGARIQFHAMDAAQSRVLLGRPGAEELDVKGRAIAVLPGREALTFQAPMIKHSELRMLRGDGPSLEMPDLPEDVEKRDKVEQVLELHAEGVSNRKIEEEVYGYTGGYATTSVNRIIKGATTTT